ncbi:MAG: glutamine amidotransferase-related protein, partial [Candidatus Limnocylindrus sp.]
MAADAGATVSAGAPPAQTGGIIVLDFGSQFAQLITRRVREMNVYAALVPFDAPLVEILARKPAGIILSGSPYS